ncbi:MAG TPA: biphenyl 2,3-dioxygenase [Halieaceae bacterium]|jgi:3,4-dihydroxy-9,10-secoandrosta-1,3,5(10)-triene-9,17-dione 4,5-dioxygenase|nr:VOC family protein [Luminiphilus sp.]MBL6902099.1 VOC family protein [Luminiphilus sp.]MDA0892940.1 VOC family protein [Pseudomonadota bacterium]HBQ02654.1 biphenyl 2,3-dioxygenase [Halieaceae bacterium]|tara:strand:+ start:286 stop:1191 length:906 start_codon:yes stop_codon:yes gene_type:complete
MAIQSLGYIGVNATSLISWRDFSCDIMGLEDVSAALGDENTHYYKMDTHPYRLFVQHSETDGLRLCGWETNNQAGLDEVAAALTAAKVPFAWGDDALITKRRVQNILSFTDPAGNHHEAYWGVVSDFKPLNSPQAVSGFVTGDQGLGHIVLPAPNFDDTTTFFTEVLGFGLSDLMKIRFTPDPAEPVKRLWFMHCNRRHHSLGLFEMAHPAGCIHVMTEVNTLDEVGRCDDRRIAAGAQLSGTLGRHANDHMVSFYMRSPAGFDVEYGTEGRTIDDWSKYEVFESTVPSFWGHDFSVGQQG